MGCWWRLLGKNRFRVALRKLPIAVGVSVFSPLNDLLALSQAVLYGRKIAKTEISKPPVFILGHWRSGTTLLHELLVRDPQFESPNTFQCFAPSHFLLSEPLMVRLGGFLLPKHRPMDNMEAGWQLPQEDEFALMNLGVPSPYLRIAFPLSQEKLLSYLDMQDLSEKESQQWQDKFQWFLKVLTYHYGGKQLVLKSPPHTGRIEILVKMFPDAKFIHLTRDPIKLFPSTVRLWNALESVQALQESPPKAEVQAYVKTCLTKMYDRFESTRNCVPAGNLIDVRYEDLAADPLSVVRSLYQQLDLGDFAQVEADLKRKLANHADYQPNQHAIDPDLRRDVLEAWPQYAASYGYSNSRAGNDVCEAKVSNA